MQQKVFNNPETGVQEEFVEFYNNSGGALAHGDVVIKDLTATTYVQKQYGTTSTTQNDNKLLGVVWDPQGLGVANGARGLLMRQGYHSAVNFISSTTTASIGTLCVHDTTAGTADIVSASATVYPGGTLGHLAEAITAAQTTAAIRVDIK